jgi:nucleoside-diphosphate-sugar epimerase
MHDLVIALLGSKGFIGRYVAKSCLEAGIPFVELPRWNGNQNEFDSHIQQLRKSNLGKRIVLVQTAWYSTNNSDYRTSPENYEWLKITKAIVEICRNYQVVFAGLGTCLEKLVMDEDVYTACKSQIRSYLDLQFPINEWVWFQLHYVYSVGHLKPAVLRKAAEAIESGDSLTLGTPNDNHDFIEVRDAAHAITHSLVANLRGVVEIGTGKTLEVSSFLTSLFPNLEIIKGRPIEKRISFQGIADNEKLVNSGWTPKFSSC